MGKKVKIDSGSKKKLEDKVSKMLMKAPPPKAPPPEKKAIEHLSKQLNKIVPGLDKKILTAVADELKKHNPKAPKGTPKKIKAIPKMKPPGGGTPSVSIPLLKLKLDEKYGTTGKLELKVWADPKELAKSEKGVMLYFTIKKF